RGAAARNPCGSIVGLTSGGSVVRLLRLTVVGRGLAAASGLPAQAQDFSKVEIKSVQLGANLYLLEGSGGNIAALTGSDGVLLVDDEFGALADKIRAALRGLGANQPVRFVINT